MWIVVTATRKVEINGTSSLRHENDAIRTEKRIMVMRFIIVNVWRIIKIAKIQDISHYPFFFFKMLKNELSNSLHGYSVWKKITTFLRFYWNQRGGKIILDFNGARFAVIFCHRTCLRRRSFWNESFHEKHLLIFIIADR